MIDKIPELLNFNRCFLNSTGSSATNHRFFPDIDANQPKAGTIERPFHPWARWAQMVLRGPLSSTGNGWKEGWVSRTNTLTLHIEYVQSGTLQVLKFLKF